MRRSSPRPMPKRILASLTSLLWISLRSVSKAGRPATFSTWVAAQVTSVAALLAVFPKVRLDGIDGSRAMLHWGYKAVAERQLQQRVRLHHGYLPGADFPRRDYDIVISNSLLHHLADPAVLWRLLPTVGRPGARVFVMDLVRPATLEEARRLKQLYSSEEPPILQRDFFNSLLAAYTTREVEEQLRQAGLERFEVRQVSDRHQIIFGRL